MRGYNRGPWLKKILDKVILRLITKELVGTARQSRGDSAPGNGMQSQWAGESLFQELERNVSLILPARIWLRYWRQRGGCWQTEPFQLLTSPRSGPDACRWPALWGLTAARSSSCVPASRRPSSPHQTPVVRPYSHRTTRWQSGLLQLRVRWSWPCPCCWPWPPPPYVCPQLAPVTTQAPSFPLRSGTGEDSPVSTFLFNIVLWVRARVIKTRNKKLPDWKGRSKIVSRQWHDLVYRKLL